MPKFVTPMEWSEVERGTEIKVLRQRGVYVYEKLNTDGSVCVFGGPNGKAMFRSFHPDNCRIIVRRVSKIRS